MEHLLESLDIGSGLTRKQTIKRKFRNLSKNAKLNNLLHKRVALDRQLKALLKDLRISSPKDFTSETNNSRSYMSCILDGFKIALSRKEKRYQFF